MAAPPNGPRRASIAELLQGTIGVLREHAGAMVWLVLAVAVPLQLLGLGVALAVAGSDGAEAYRLGANLVTAAAALTGLFATVGCLYVAIEARAGNTVTWAQGLLLAGSLAGPIVLLALLAGLGLVAGFLLLVLPGIWLAILWSMAFPALVVEGARGRRALGRSADLVRGRWWSTFGALLVGYLLAGVMAGIVQSVLLSVMGVSNGQESTGALVALVGATVIGQCISHPLTATYLALLFGALRESEGPAAPVASGAGPGAPTPVVSGAGAAPPPPPPPPPAPAGMPVEGGFLPPVAAPGEGRIAPPGERPPGAGDA